MVKWVSLAKYRDIIQVVVVFYDVLVIRVPLTAYIRQMFFSHATHARLRVARVFVVDRHVAYLGRLTEPREIFLVMRHDQPHFDKMEFFFWERWCSFFSGRNTADLFFWERHCSFFLGETLQIFFFGESQCRSFSGERRCRFFWERHCNFFLGETLQIFFLGETLQKFLRGETVQKFLRGETVQKFLRRETRLDCRLFFFMADARVHDMR